jgi:hypothetical protein
MSVLSQTQSATKMPFVPMKLEVFLVTARMDSLEMASFVRVSVSSDPIILHDRLIFRR